MKEEEKEGKARGEDERENEDIVFGRSLGDADGKGGIKDKGK